MYPVQRQVLYSNNIKSLPCKIIISCSLLCSKEMNAIKNVIMSTFGNISARNHECIYHGYCIVLGVKQVYGKDEYLIMFLKIGASKIKRTINISNIQVNHNIMKTLNFDHN